MAQNNQPNSVQTYYKLDAQNSDLILNSDMWSLIVPEYTENLLYNPGFEGPYSVSDLTVSNCTPTQSSDWQMKGVYSLKVVPTSTASACYIQQPTGYLGRPELFVNNGGTLTWSIWLKASGGEYFAMSFYDQDNSTTFATSEALRATGGMDRFSLTTTLPAPSSNTGLLALRLTKITQTTHPFYTDDWQLEEKNYPTEYVDGDQSNGSWFNGDPYILPTPVARTNGSYIVRSRRLADAPCGREITFKQLGLLVLGWDGAGAGDFTHQVSQSAFGGEFYRRSIPSARTITMVCAFNETSFLAIQKRRALLERYLMPDASSFVSNLLYLRYTPVDECGNLFGKVLEAPVRYATGLPQNTTDMNQDRFVLQFREFNPPSIRELRGYGYLVTNLNQSLPIDRVPVVFAPEYADAQLVSPKWQLWKPDISGTPPAYAFSMTTFGLYLYVGTSVGLSRNTLYNNTVTSMQKVGTYSGGVYGLATFGQNIIYAVGNFTSPASYITANGSALVATSGTAPSHFLNAVAVTNSGNVYTGGYYTAGVSPLFHYRYGTGWVALSTTGDGKPTGIVNAIAITQGGAGNVLVGCNTGRYLCCFVPSQDTLTPEGSWVTSTDIGKDWFVKTGPNGAVRAIAMLPDGNAVFGGDFTTVDGVTVNHVAIWTKNGGFKPLTLGLNGPVHTLSVDNKTGDIYAGGNFTGTGDGFYTFPSPIARFDGSRWQPIDVSIGTGIGAVYTSYYQNGNGNTLSANLYFAYGSKEGTTDYTEAFDSGESAAVNFEIDNTGGAPSYPTITFTGPGILRQITNVTTGRSLYFKNYAIQATEVATLVLDPSGLTFTSSYMGNILRQITSGSDFSRFYLAQGANKMRVLYTYKGTKTTQSITLKWENIHWSFNSIDEAVLL